MTNRIFLMLILISTLGFSAPALAAEPGNGTLDGYVVNRTEDGGSVADQGVTLKIYLNDNEVDSATTTTDNNGYFIFEGLATDSTYSYQVQILYQEADYVTDRLGFTNGQTSLTTELTVYDATDSDEDIRVMTAHTIIKVEEDVLRVTEYYYFENGADRTYVGSEIATPDGKKATLSFSLPQQATGLETGGGLMSCCIYGNDTGFIDTMPFLPGPKEMVYTYLVDYDAGSYTFNQMMYYPVEDYNLLVQGEDVTLSGERLRVEPPMTIENSLYQRLSGANLAADDSVMVKISGLPESGTPALLWIIVTAAVLAGATFFGLNMRGKKARPVPAGGDPARKERELLVELARLDDSFADGKIGETEYRRRRASTKEKLTRLMQGQRKRR